MNEKLTTYDRWDLALFIYTLAGISISLTASLSMVVLGLFALIGQDGTNAQSAQWSAVGLLALAAVAVPALIESGRSIFGGQKSTPNRPGKESYWLAVLFPMGLIFGFLGYEESVLPGLLGPMGQLLAVATPAIIIVVLLRRAGPLLKPRRLWGHFLAGLWAIPFVTILVEVVILIMGLAVTGIGLIVTPEGQRLIERLTPYLNTPGAEPTDIPEELLLDIALNPLIIVALLFFLGLMVPIIEEVLKSATVWPFLPRKIDPAVAFMGGALGGTGFAFAEAMFLTQPMTGWLTTAVARSGATSMHAFAAGLTAWGLAQGFIGKRWGRLIAALLGAIGLHGLWNAAAIGVSLGQAAQEQGEIGNPSLSFIIGISIAIIIALSLVSFALLPYLQKRFTPTTQNTNEM